MITVEICETPLDFADVAGAFEATVGDAGGMITFAGRVRSRNAEGPVSGLTLEHHPRLTHRWIRHTAEEAIKRWTLTSVDIRHRVGTMVPGEMIVFVGTAAAHRRAAFESADFLMDYLKTEAFFWKKESGPQGHRWLTPRSEDYRDRDRWRMQTG